MLYWRMQVETHHSCNYTSPVQFTPSYLVSTCEKVWGRSVHEKQRTALKLTSKRVLCTRYHKQGHKP